MQNSERTEPNSFLDLVETRAERYQKLRKPAEIILNYLYGDCGLKSKENQANLDLAREYLKRGSIVWTFDHPSLDDGVLVTLTILSEFGGVVQDISGPQSLKHYDPNRDVAGAIMTRLIRPVSRIDYRPVVQAYDLDSYSEVERNRLNLGFGRRARELLKQPGGVLIIAPGGTRDCGKLIRAEKGVEFLRRSGPLVRFLPIAIIPQGPIGEEFNFGHQYQLTVGQLFSAEQLEGKFNQLGFSTELEFRDKLMVELGSYLPPQMRGVYTSEVAEYVSLMEASLL